MKNKKECCEGRIENLNPEVLRLPQEHAVSNGGSHLPRKTAAPGFPDMALQRSEALLNATQRLSKIGGWEWDVEKQTMFWTDETYRIHDCVRDELMPGAPEHIQKSLACYEPEDRPVILQAFQRCAGQGQPYDHEFPFTTPTGRRLWVRTTAQPVWDADRVASVVGTIMDITDRRRAEEALRQSEEKFRLAFQTSPDSINLNRLSDGMYVDVNEGFTKLTGYTREDAVGKTSVELNIWADPRDRERLVQGLRSKGYVENLEARFRRKNGQMSFGLMSARVLRLNQEDVILSITRDITERKEVDEKLRETERKYRELAESLPQVIFEVDSKGDLVYLNQTGCGLFGYTPEDLARGFNVVEAFIPEDRERIASDIMLNVQGQKLGRQEYTALKKDGTPFPVGFTLIESCAGKTATGVRGILIDFTPVKLAEEEKKKLEIQLQQAQKMEAIGALAGGIAHDFNNILSAIIGYTELAMLNEGGEHCTAELNEALKAANRAKDLVKQILAFSRQTDEERMPVRAALVAQEAVKFIRATLPATIEIKTRIDEKSGAVLANSVELHQIIMNLCTNAQHAIGEQAGLWKWPCKIRRLTSRRKMI